MRPILTHIDRRRRHMSMVLAALSLMAATGAGCNDEEKQTKAGLQEENSVLRERIETVEKENAQLRKDQESGDTITESSLRQANEQLQERLEAVEAEKQTALADAQMTHRTRAAQLEEKIASLRLELSTAQRERLALREIVDREPRLRDAARVRASSATRTLLVLFLMLCLLLGFVAVRYRATRERLNMLTMRSVSELRFLGGVK